MKNTKVVVIPLVSLLMFVPVVAFAQTTTDNNSRIAAEITALQQLIVVLTQELKTLLAQHHQGIPPALSTQSSVAPTNSTVSGTSDYTSYTSVSMALYADDTSAYLGSDIVVTGMVNAFMPEGGTGGTTNYIQIINPFDESQPKMQLEVDDSSTYSAAVNSLQDTSSPIYRFVRAYGTGVPNQELTETSLFGSGNISVPVVNVTRIDKCIHGSMNDTILTGTSFDYNFTCTEWETIAPTSEAGTLYPTTSQTPSTPTQPTTPPTTSKTQASVTNTIAPSCTLTITSSGSGTYSVSYQSQNAGPGVIAPFNATTTSSAVATYAESYLTDYYQFGWNRTDAGDQAGLAPINPMTFTPYGGALSGSTMFNSTGYVKGVPWTGFVATFINNEPQDGVQFAQCTVNVSQTQQMNGPTGVTQPAPATLSLGNPSVTYNGAPQAAVITSSTPGNIVSVEYNGSANLPTMPGTYAVTADFAPATDPNNYSARMSVGNLVINAGSAPITPANQTIRFGASNNDVLQNVTYGIVGFTVDAQASSGLGVNFTAQGDCTVSGGPGTASLSITGVGSCTITASQPGNQYYNPAPDVSQTFTISPTPSALDSNATLSDLMANGTAISGFSPSTYTYTVTVPAGLPQAPTVVATVEDPTATDVITQATDSLGSATVVVTAQNGTTRNTYTVNFKPSDAGQCNFNGDIFTCASDSGISVNPTTLPNATVGTSYNEPVTISDPDTSSQSFRWNGISGIFPPGLSLAFSGNTSFECSGTNCYFAPTPSGVSVPSRDGGVFFGTPTAAGTYSFTMQAIDSSDYIALPTFTLTVASSTGQ